MTDQPVSVTSGNATVRVVDGEPISTSANAAPVLLGGLYPLPLRGVPHREPGSQR